MADAKKVRGNPKVSASFAFRMRAEREENEKVGTLPPEASTTCPVTKLDRAAARKLTTSAMSEDCPMRFDACLPKANDAPRIAHESRRDIGVEDARSDGFDRSG